MGLCLPRRLLATTEASMKAAAMITVLATIAMKKRATSDIERKGRGGASENTTVETGTDTLLVVTIIFTTGKNIRKE